MPESRSSEESTSRIGSQAVRPSWIEAMAAGLSLVAPASDPALQYLAVWSLDSSSTLLLEDELNHTIGAIYYISIYPITPLG